MTTYEKPIVFIIDIDGTMIGDIRPQLMLYELHLALKHANKKINMLNIKDFEDKLKNGGIVRPYFTKFLKKMKDYLPNVEFFVYTASETVWAKFLINHIEKALGIKFNRPIFTREDCFYDNQNIKKSLCTITPVVLKHLKKKYGHLKRGDLENRLLMIDNTSGVFDERDKKYVIHCESYDYTHPENIYITRILYDKYSDIINSVLGKYMNLSNVKNYMNFQHVFYTYYVNNLTKLYGHNQRQIKDHYFLTLLTIILDKNIKQFSPETISYLERKTKKLK